MKVLVTGASGRLGRSVTKRLQTLGIDHKGVKSADCDLNNGERVRGFIAGYSPDAVIHLAAFTDVDRAEAETGQCLLVNSVGTRNIAEACRLSRAKLLYVSTDYVFGKESGAPFEVDDEPAPVNLYGYSKLLGERTAQAALDQLFIVRTSWVFAPWGRSFAASALERAKQDGLVLAASDCVGAPTYTEDLAALLCGMIQTDAFGTYHAANDGFCTRYDFAKAVIQAAGLSCEVRPATSDCFSLQAQRPCDSRLSLKSLDAAGFSRLPHWKNAVERFVKEWRAESGEWS